MVRKLKKVIIQCSRSLDSPLPHGLHNPTNGSKADTIYTKTIASTLAPHRCVSN